MFTMSQTPALTELMLGDHLLVWGFVYIKYTHTDTQSKY